jgi:8-oxo-dGTP pyrophosphatase MutT (NUDIX family)
MEFEQARRRLSVLPDPLPPPPAALRPVLLLGGGPLPVLPDPAAGPARAAAVLALVHPGPEGDAQVVLTERPVGDLRHSGEVSLPGGAIDPDDASAEEAALREAREEIGLDVDQAGVQLVGRLEVVQIPVSGFELVPVVAIAERLPILVPDAREVAAVIHAPLAHFLPDAPIETIEEERSGRRLRYGYFPVGPYRVWGATARILGQLGAVVGS